MTCLRLPFTDHIDLQDDLAITREAIALARRVQRRLSAGELRTAERVARGGDPIQAAADLAAQEG